MTLDVFFKLVRYVVVTPYNIDGYVQIPHGRGHKDTRERSRYDHTHRVSALIKCEDFFPQNMDILCVHVITDNLQYMNFSK